MAWRGGGGSAREASEERRLVDAWAEQDDHPLASAIGCVVVVNVAASTDDSAEAGQVIPVERWQVWLSPRLDVYVVVVDRGDEGAALRARLLPVTMTYDPFVT